MSSEFSVHHQTLRRLGGNNLSQLHERTKQTIAGYADLDISDDVFGRGGNGADITAPYREAIGCLHETSTRLAGHVHYMCHGLVKSAEAYKEADDSTAQAVTETQ